MSEKRTGDERSRSKSSRRTGSRSAKRSKPRPPRAEKDSSAPAAEDLGRDRDPEKRPPDPFENYQYPNDRGFLRILLLLLELLGVVLLFVLCFAPPNLASGSVSVLRDTAGEEFVGVLRKCSASTCDPWLGGSTDASSASSDSLDFPTMYLTTGLATLSAFWILLYLLIFTFIRFAFFGVPPSIESSGKRQAWKRFAYRATRVWLVVLCILIGAILLDVIVKGSQYRSLEKLSGIDGVGPGIASESLRYQFQKVSGGSIC
ncbi:hypothetical protein BD324DRAFT_621768 [Kockovaella imperatae]|uniref:Uncharacterized protein n=1 Tax=Kockovaella imperatae TaxID=4999 RepID=A0A1Y1UMC7_9TREE|nr:hypothetical protein BD324DRAFT_621768 [Kockovaella imperatae]ORX38644.1 hypothetical protein BD324DRAFT_621768 [Kockovaella imperatae]